MNNKDKLQDTFVKSKALANAVIDLTSSIEAISGKYSLCFHHHYEKPRFTVWVKDVGTDGYAEIEIDGIACIIDKGRYSDDEVLEMQGIIEDWLKQGE